MNRHINYSLILRTYIQFLLTSLVHLGLELHDFFFLALGSNWVLASKKDSISPAVLLKLSCPHQVKLQAAIWYNSIMDPFCFSKGFCALGSLLKGFKPVKKSQASEN